MMNPEAQKAAAEAREVAECSTRLVPAEMRSGIATQIDRLRKAISDFFKPFSDIAGLADRIRSAVLKARNAAEIANSLVIDSNEMYEIGADQLIALSQSENELEDIRKSMTGPLDQFKKTIMDFFRPIVAFIASSKTDLKSKMLAFRQEVERRRQAEAAALRAAEEAKRQAEQEQMLAMAEELTAAGLEEGAMAAQLEAELVSSMPVTVAPTIATPKAAGVSLRDNWKAEVTDLAALVKAAAERPELLALLLPNMPEINSRARALKDHADIPGVRVFNEQTLAARTK